MSRDPSKIFLSAASGDYEQVRRNLAKALDRGGCHIVHQDAFPQTASDTLLKLAQLVDRCGMTVHIIGRQPGSIPRPEIRAQYLAVVDPCGEFLAARPALRAALADFSTITYTQWEAYIALHLGMPLFVYADPSHADPHHPQRDHIDRLKANGRYPNSYVDEAHLYRLVMADLMAHFLLNPATRGLAARIQPSNLPGSYIGRLFLGREDFLADIRASLHGSGHATAITQQAAATGISGLGGIGKTHAAVEYAHRHRADYTALLFATADSPERLRSSLADLCGVLHLNENGSLPPEEPARVAAALGWLAAHPGWLLIVDNVDDEAAALALTALLGHLTAGHVLITSRLHGWSDQVKNIDLDVLTVEAAAELLLRLTADRRRLAPDDEAQALELTKLLEGLPLAIHQAAGFINERTRTLAAYHAEYQREAETLLNWFNDLAIPYERPDKLAPRPVLITWKTSFDQLTDDEKFWLLVFSHFSPEPIPEFLLEPTEGAAPEDGAMLDQAATAVARAEKFCLLTRSRNEPVFKLHRLVQEATRLQAAEEDRYRAIDRAINLVLLGRLGDPSDVRSWPKWSFVERHAVALCLHSRDEKPTKSITRLLTNLGSLLHTKGLLDEADSLYRRARQINSDQLGNNNVYKALDLNNCASILLEKSRFHEAEELLREALDIDRKRLGPHDPSLALRLGNLGRLLHDTNRLSEAEEFLVEAVRISRSAHGDQDPRLTDQTNNLACVYMATGRIAQAEVLLREALKIDLASYGPKHPFVTRDINNLAQLLHDAGRFREALPLMALALDNHVAAYGPDHPAVATCSSNLGRLLKDLMRYSEAELLLRNALRIDQAVYGGDHPNVGTCLCNLGSLLHAMGRLAEAERLMKESLKIHRDSLGHGHPAVAKDLNNLALLFRNTNRPTEAEPLLRDALQILYDSLGPTHANTISVSQHLDQIRSEIASASGVSCPSAEADGVE